MAALKVELEQKEKTIRDLKEALRRQKEEAEAQRQQHADSISSQLSLQRLEYEAQVTRGRARGSGGAVGGSGGAVGLAQADAAARVRGCAGG